MAIGHTFTDFMLSRISIRANVNAYKSTIIRKVNFMEITQKYIITPPHPSKTKLLAIVPLKRCRTNLKFLLFSGWSGYFMSIGSVLLVCTNLKTPIGTKVGYGVNRP